MPDFRLKDPWVTSHVTVADLFSHRSGLPDHAGDLLEDLGYDRPYILSHLRYEPLAPFRASYAYTNFGLTAAAQAVADAKGMPWEKLAADTLYKPAGMDSTSSRFEDYAQAANRPMRSQH
ncbi:serine hydrolase [Streptomyces sp. P17]|uniref:serine hydrolase n=1 Tax=Streptomyces sp. P17 TaxID=3074716 RepID=UPI0037DC0F61